MHGKASQHIPGSLSLFCWGAWVGKAHEVREGPRLDHHIGLKIGYPIPSTGSSFSLLKYPFGAYTVFLDTAIY